MAHTIAAAADKDVQWRQWVAPAALFVVGLAFYSINIDGLPRFDELYHVLAARGYLEYGEPRIAEGIYGRARYFTAAIALLFDAFGESLVVARLPAVVSGSLLAALMFVWLRRVAGPMAAWFATIAFLFSPFALHVFQDVRFYAPFTLLFWLGAMAVYAAGTAERLASGRVVWLTLAAAVCFGGALYLQPLTLIGVVGLSLWLGVQIGLPWLRASSAGKRVAIVLVFAALVAGLALVLPLGELIHRYRATPLFAAAERNQFWFYHQWLNLYYPTLWTLFPLTALAALAGRPRPALFCLCVFVTAFLLLSFGGMKGMLYATFVLPFLFALWGMAIAYVWAGLRRFVVEVTEAALRGLGVPQSRATRNALIAATVGFALLANSATIRTATMLGGFTIPPLVAYADWGAAAEPLKPWLDQSSVVLTTSELETLYYLGDYDFLINKSRRSELPEPVEFGRDPRTGRPVLSTPESVGLIIDCFPDGLIVTSKQRWRVSHQLDDAIADEIIRRAIAIELPRGSQIMAFRWEQPSGAVRPAACADLPQLRRKPAGERGGGA